MLATSHMFGVHMGWADMATAAPIAERAALAAIQADSEDPWAHTALGSVCFSTRRFDDSLAEFELALQLNPNFSLAQGYYALALSYCGRWRGRRSGGAARASGSVRAIRSRRSITASPPMRSSSGETMPRRCALAREGIRQRGDFIGAYRVLTAAAGMAGQAEVAAAALQELRRAQPNISLAWIANQMPMEARFRPRALSRRLPPRRP